MINGRTLCLAMAVLLGGCQGMPRLTSDAPPNTASSGDLESRIGALPAQRLHGGECGIFLWTRTPDRRLLFFSRGQDRVSRMMIDGREQEIPRIAFGGENMMGQNTRQTYEWRDIKVDIALDFERRPGLDRGAVVPQGTLRVSNREGWDYVMPVGGLLACEK